MARGRPIQTIYQDLECQVCRRLYPLKECHRMMNFTFNEIRFFCIHCHLIIASLNFKRWNELHYLAERGVKPPSRPDRPSRPGRRGPHRPISSAPKKPEGEKPKPQNSNDKLYQRNLPD